MSMEFKGWLGVVVLAIVGCATTQHNSTTAPPEYLQMARDAQEIAREIIYQTTGEKPSRRASKIVAVVGERNSYGDYVIPSKNGRKAPAYAIANVIYLGIGPNREQPHNAADILVHEYMHVLGIMGHPSDYDGKVLWWKNSRVMGEY